MGIPEINSNHGCPSCGWKPSFHATHWVAAHMVMSTTAKTIMIWPQSILVADMMIKDQGATIALDKGCIW